MCSEHNIFVRVVDRRNLITVGRVWSSWCSYTVCLASADYPHEASDLINSSRVLARCRALLTMDADRTPSIDVCRFFGCSRSSTDILERILKIFLRFCRLTTLVAHFSLPEPQAEILGYSLKTLCPLLFLFFSLGSFWTSNSHTRLPHTHYSLSEKFYARPTFSSLLK